MTNCESPFDWSQIRKDSWCKVPYIEGRNAKEEDVLFGRAVFYIPSDFEDRDVVNSYKLPFLALMQFEEGEKEVVVIQIEIHPEDGELVVGYRLFDGGNGVAMFDELKLLNR